MFIFLSLGFFLAFAQPYCGGFGRLAGDYLGRGVDDVLGVGLEVGMGSLTAGTCSGDDSFFGVDFSFRIWDCEYVFLFYKIVAGLSADWSANVPVHHCYITNQIADVSLFYYDAVPAIPISAHSSFTSELHSSGNGCPVWEILALLLIYFILVGCNLNFLYRNRNIGEMWRVGSGWVGVGIGVI